MYYIHCAISHDKEGIKNLLFLGVKHQLYASDAMQAVMKEGRGYFLKGRHRLDIYDMNAALKKIASETRTADRDNLHSSA